MAQQDYNGLTVGLKFDSFSDRFVVGVEVDGGFIPFAQLSEAKFNKHYQLSGAQPPQPVAQPSEPSPEQPPGGVAAPPQQ